MNALALARVAEAQAVAAPRRILFVFAWLVVGGEETEVRLLAEHLDSADYVIEVVVCFRNEAMPEQTHDQLRALGVRVDTTPYHLNFDDTVTYLAGRLPAYDVVVSCQNVADIYPALERLALRPPLIEHGGLVSEAENGPKHLTARYVGVCETIRAAAAARMPDREHDALAIPSMVDMRAFDPAQRASVRAELGVGNDRIVIGWVGRLDRKKRVEDFIDAAILVARRRADVDFVVIGGADAFMPDYADALRERAAVLGARIRFLGDRADVPRLLSGLDIFAWLSRGEGMPHVIAEAGAARLPVIATPDNGALEQIVDGRSGVFVPHEDPAAVADAMLALAGDPARRRALGDALNGHVRRHYAVDVVLPQWQALFDAVAAEKTLPEPAAPLFKSFFMGGFECSSHRRGGDRERRDVIALSEHDTRAGEDYALLRAHGILTVRDGVRWHLVEAERGRYDWSSVDAQLTAARTGGTQVLWDVLHYGWPDWIDIWRADFPQAFATFAARFAAHVGAYTLGPHFFCPINEISFLSWGGGDVGYLNPFGRGRGHELKVQLARAAIMAMDAIRRVLPAARFVHCEPVINVVAHPHHPHDAVPAFGHNQAQYQAWEMIAGRMWPQLGGREELLDIVGVNYYHTNQWFHGGTWMHHSEPFARPFRELLAETYARYGRPIFIAETGTEGDGRANWLDHIAQEVAGALALGVPVEGVCLYPVLGHLGWDNDRYCDNGLIDWAPGDKARSVDAPTAAALGRAQRLLQRL